MISAGRSKGSTVNKSGALTDPSLRPIPTQIDCFPQHVNSSLRYCNVNFELENCSSCRRHKRHLKLRMLNCLSFLLRDSGESQLASHVSNPPLSRVSSDQVCYYFQMINL